MDTHTGMKGAQGCANPHHRAAGTDARNESVRGETQTGELRQKLRTRGFKMRARIVTV